MVEQSLKLQRARVVYGIADGALVPNIFASALSLIKVVPILTADTTKNLGAAIGMLLDLHMVSTELADA